MKDRIADFMQALLSLDRFSAKQMLDEGAHQVNPMRFIEEVVVAALERIGAGWHDGTIALSQVYMGGRICEDLIDEVLPPATRTEKISPKWPSVCLRIIINWEKQSHIRC